MTSESGGGGGRAAPDPRVRARPRPARDASGARAACRARRRSRCRSSPTPPPPVRGGAPRQRRPQPALGGARSRGGAGSWAAWREGCCWPFRDAQRPSTRARCSSTTSCSPTWTPGCTRPTATTTRCWASTRRHMAEIDERHLILQEELVAHVHDLVKRIDLVLAEAEKGRAEPGVRAARPARPAAAARGAHRARMKTVLVCAVQAPFITGGAEILVAGAAREPRAARLPGGRGQRALQVVPGLGDRAAGAGLAPAGRDREQRHAGRPGDPHQVPELPGAPPAQGGLALPPAPRGLRPLRHALLLLPRHARRTTRCARPSTPWTDRARRVPARSSPSRATWPTGWRATTSLPGTPLYPPPHHLGRYRCDEYGDFLFYAGRLDRLKRLDLAIDAMKRVRSGARLKIAGTGPLQEELRKQIAGLGVEDRVELLGFVSADELLALYARCRAALLRAAQRGLRLRDGGGVPLPQARGHHHRRRRAAGVRERRRDRPGGRAPSPRRWPPPSTGCGQLPEARLREMGEAGHARVEDITWDHVIDRLTEGAAREAGRVEPVAAVAFGDRGLRGGVAAAARRRTRTWSTGAARSRARSRSRPTSTSTTSATRRPTPTSTARPAPAGGGGPPRLEPAPPGAARDGGARRRARLSARDAPGLRRDGHLRGPAGGARAGRRPAARALPAERPRPGRQPGRRRAHRSTCARARRGGCPAGPSCICPTTWPCRSIRCPASAEARRALGLPEDALLVTAPGLATAAKRLDVAIRAWPRACGASSRAAAGGGRRRGSRAAARRVGGRRASATPSW